MGKAPHQYGEPPSNLLPAALLCTSGVPYGIRPCPAPEQEKQFDASLIPLRGRMQQSIHSESGGNRRADASATPIIVF